MIILKFDNNPFLDALNELNKAYDNRDREAWKFWNSVVKKLENQFQKSQIPY